jgi:predicted RNA-binding Zn ribbon-like protein
MQPAENDFDTWAPPAATVVRDFVNSYEPQEAAEFLAPAGARLTADDVRAARRVREGLRAVLLAHAGHDADPVASQELDAELARIPLRAAFDADGGIRLEGSGTAFERGMAGVLDAVRRCEAAGDWERLKVCARDTCRWAFYDASRNHARRWCSMSGCGNYVKMRRRAATRTP